jgi:hypothetical protein
MKKIIILIIFLFIFINHSFAVQCEYDFRGEKAKYETTDSVFIWKIIKIEKKRLYG